MSMMLHRIAAALSSSTIASTIISVTAVGCLSHSTIVDNSALAHFSAGKPLFLTAYILPKIELSRASK